MISNRKNLKSGGANYSLIASNDKLSALRTGRVFLTHPVRFVLMAARGGFK